jgi:hypothetical protein
MLTNAVAKKARNPDENEISRLVKRPKSPSGRPKTRVALADARDCGKLIGSGSF